MKPLSCHDDLACPGASKRLPCFLLRFEVLELVTLASRGGVSAKSLVSFTTPRKCESQNSSLGMFTIKIMCLRVLDGGYFSRVTSQQQQGKSSPVVVPENSLQSSKCSESIRRTEPRAPPRVKNSSAECFCFAHGHTTNDERRTTDALRPAISPPRELVQTLLLQRPWKSQRPPPKPRTSLPLMVSAGRLR